MRKETSLLDAQLLEESLKAHFHDEGFDVLVGTGFRRNRAVVVFLNGRYWRIETIFTACRKIGASDVSLHAVWKNEPVGDESGRVVAVMKF